MREKVRVRRTTAGYASPSVTAATPCSRESARERERESDCVCVCVSVYVCEREGVREGVDRRVRQPFTHCCPPLFERL